MFSTPKFLTLRQIYFAETGGFRSGVLNINPFMGLFFTLFLFQIGDGGIAVGDIRVYY